MEWTTVELILIVLFLNLITNLAHLIGFCRRTDRLPLIEGLLKHHGGQNFA